jgi:hypothetical protein
MKKNKMDIASAIKKAMRTNEAVVIKPGHKPMHTERDMRKEAMDMGAHGAKEYFGDGNE